MRGKWDCYELFLDLNLLIKFLVKFLRIFYEFEVFKGFWGVNFGVLIKFNKKKIKILNNNN